MCDNGASGDILGIVLQSTWPGLRCPTDGSITRPVGQIDTDSVPL